MAGAKGSDRLTPLDATFLELEEADAAAHMHIGSLTTFEERASLPPTLERLRRHVERRLGALPRYRRRLSAPHTGGALTRLGPGSGLRHRCARQARRARDAGR